jgi:hypothetical protein
MKKAFKINPLTLDELKIWKQNQLVNPRTNKTIKKNSVTFKLINKAYKELKHDNCLLNCIDDRDPISMNIFWIENNGRKKIVYPDNLINDLVFYIDKNNILRCLEQETLRYLKFYNIFTHPITLDPIPAKLFTDLEVIVPVTKTISNIALNVFQQLEKISIFIDYEWFIKLNKSELIKFNYEIRDFWLKNFNETQRLQVSPNQLLEKRSEDLDNLNIEEIQTYLLNELLILLTCEHQNLKYMINYIIVGALSIVIPKIKEFYPDFVFGFLD